VEGSCEHGDEHSDFIKCWEILEQVHNWRLLKKLVKATSSEGPRNPLCAVYILSVYFPSGTNPSPFVS
jgi:hypothetical protein